MTDTKYVYKNGFVSTVIAYPHYTQYTNMHEILTCNDLHTHTYMVCRCPQCERS